MYDTCQDHIIRKRVILITGWFANLSMQVSYLIVICESIDVTLDLQIYLKKYIHRSFATST